MFEPTELRIEVCNLCNAECVFCPHPTDDFTRKKRVMPTSNYMEYVDKVLSVYNIEDIVFSGFGEIFLDKDLLSKMKYVSSKGKNIHILTNGSYLSVDMVDKLLSIESLASIRISIHTADADKYNDILNYKDKTDYNKISDNIEYLLDNKQDSLEVTLTAVMPEDDAEDVKNLINNYSNKCFLEIWKPHNWVYGKGYRNIDQVVKTCGRPFNGPIEVLVNGDVIMCCFDFNAEMVLGNLNNNTIKEIYNSKKYLEILKHHTEGTCSDSNLICSGCDQLSGKDDILIYSNKGNENERILKASTTLNVLNKAL